MEYREVSGSRPRRSSSTQRTTTTTTYEDGGGGGGGMSYMRSGSGGGSRTVQMERSGHVGDMWDEDLTDGGSFAEFEQR